MFRSTKALLALGSFKPPEAGLLELRDAMNEQFPRRLLPDYDAVHVVETMGTLTASGLVEQPSTGFYVLSEAGITQATLMAAKHRQVTNAHTAYGS